MKARVYVTLKPSVFDPQGRVVADALVTLGYQDVKDVRQGKFIELELAETERDLGAEETAVLDDGAKDRERAKVRLGDLHDDTSHRNHRCKDK